MCIEPLLQAGGGVNCSVRIISNKVFLVLKNNGSLCHRHRDKRRVSVFIDEYCQVCGVANWHSRVPVRYLERTSPPPTPKILVQYLIWNGDSTGPGAHQNLQRWYL
jgi:hypothetical protein